MMRKLRLCCEGVDITNLGGKPKEKQTKTETWGKGNNDATVIPPKRKCVKNTVCNCFVHCISAKCFNTNNTLSPPSPTPTSAGNLFNYQFFLVLTFQFQSLCNSAILVFCFVLSLFKYCGGSLFRKIFLFIKL